MLTRRRLALFLAFSIALNLFLLGAATVHFFHHREHPTPTTRTEQAPGSERSPRNEHPTADSPKKRRAEEGGVEPPTPGHAPHARDRRPFHGPADGPRARSRRDRPRRRGPPEARLLRDIVRTMGGPKDSRVQALLEKNREDIRQFRRGIRSAQGDVRAALARTPHDEEALKTALAALRKRTSAAQKRAQSALVELSKQLTDEERRALRENRAKGSNDGAESDTEDRSDDDARQP